MMDVRVQRHTHRLLPLLLFILIPLVLPAAEPSAKVLPELHLGNADLRAVLRSLAEFGEFPLILAPEVQGKVTLPLKSGLTATETVELLAELHGYPCYWVEGTALIGAEPAALSPRTPGRYQWSAANTDVVIAALTRVVPRARLEVDAGRKEVQIMASALEAENIREVLAEVDRSTPSYLLSAELVEIELDYAQEQGLSWALPGTSVHTPLRLGVFATADAPQSKAGRRLVGTRFRTESNRPGVAFLGDQYPVIMTSPNAPVDLIQYQKIGVAIEATPKTLEDGRIDLDLVLNVSGIGGWIETADGHRVPQIENNQIMARQTLTAGETCVLAGLTFTGRGASALILTPGQEGPTKEKTVCLLITPLPEGSTPAGPGMTAAPASTPSAAGPEVIHIEIFSSEHAGTVTASPATAPTPQILTEVVGLGETKPSSGESALPELPPSGSKLVPEKPSQAPTVVGPSGEEQSAVALRVAYRVVKGDTVFSIGRKYGVAPAAILQENDLAASGFLQVGQTIRIPIPPDHLYQLQPKETLWRIAQRYGVTVELLMEINSITDVTMLRTDQIIILPVPIDQIVNENY